MSLIQLVAGAQSAWASLMTTELNSLASGNAVLGSTSLDNGTNNDLEIEFSMTTGGSITTTGTAPFAACGIYQKNGDGSTYGDGRFATAAAGPFPSNYASAFAGFPVGAGTQTGTFGVPYLGSRILLPRGIFKPVFYQLTGVSFSSSGNILYYRTSNRSIT